MFRPILVITPTFISSPVVYLKISLRMVMNVAPKIAPGIFPIPPIMTMAINSTESPRLNGSVVMLTM